MTFPDTAAAVVVRVDVSATRFWKNRRRIEFVARAGERVGHRGLLPSEVGKKLSLYRFPTCSC